MDSPTTSHEKAACREIQQNGADEATKEIGHAERYREAVEGVLMASPYYSQFKERKVSAKGKRPSEQAGSTPSMPQRQGFCGGKLPGKTQPRNRSMGVKKLNIYAHSEGL